MFYKKLIIDHSKAPKNFRPMQNSTHFGEEYNPICGDHIVVYLQIKDQIIQDISFYGDTCAIAKASASMMTALLKGKSQEEAAQLFTEFQKLVIDEPDADTSARLGELTILKDVGKHPSRLRCAQLPWQALKLAISS